MPGQAGATRRSPALGAALRATPYRLLFFVGALQLVAVMPWWALALAGRAVHAASPATALPGAWAHAALMIYGLYPPFIFGFLLTVYPRWLGDVEAPAWLHLPAAALFAAGAVLMQIGLFTSLTAGTMALSSLAGGWLAGLAALVRAHLLRRTWGGPAELGVLLPLVAGLPCLLAGLVWLGAGTALAYRLSIDGGTWFFLVPLVLAVATRMIPFFTRGVLGGRLRANPRWTVPVLAALAAAHGALSMAGQVQWLALVDLPLAAFGLLLARRWRFGEATGDRLLRMLRVAFLWWPVAMVLYAVQSLAVLAGEGFVLGRAPLHALALGFLTPMVLAMVSRITQAHAGDLESASDLTWRAFHVLQLAAVLRVGAELASAGTGAADATMIAAAALWLVAAVPWAARYAAACWRPRTGGRETERRP